MLTRGSSYNELHKWIVLKKIVINLKINDKWSFKWAVVAVLHHEETAKDLQWISRLEVPKSMQLARI